MGNSSNMWFTLLVVVISCVLLNQVIGKEIPLMRQHELLNNQDIQNKVSEWLPNDHIQLMRKKRADCCGHLDGSDNPDAGKDKEKGQESPVQEGMKDSAQPRRLSRHTAGEQVQDAKEQKDLEHKTIEANISSS